MLPTDLINTPILTALAMTVVIRVISEFEPSTRYSVDPGSWHTPQFRLTMPYTSVHTIDKKRKMANGRAADVFSYSMDPDIINSAVVEPKFS